MIGPFHCKAGVTQPIPYNDYVTRFLAASMSGENPFLRPADEPVPTETVDVSYRCVCGEVFPVALDAGATCPACERKVSPDALTGAMSETMAVSFVGEGPTSGRRPSEHQEDDAQIGETFGHYRLISKLGQGGMGAVYQALDESLQRYVALKVILSTVTSAADTKNIKRLQQEAVAQARVNHPNVVHIYFVGREGDTPFFAMEMVPGPTLEDRLEKGPLPFDEVIAFGQQVVNALRHCAKFDIVHGDIKPSNILLADSHTVKLSDFGLARRMSQVESNPLLVAGTPNYLSPEAAEGRNLDIRSDMYSLGITLFEMAFGRLPYSFTGSSLFEYLQIHRTAEVEFPEPWPESVPEGWRDVLEKLLAKSPEDRYQSYDQLVDDLQRLRPQALPKAGRVQRGLAWMVDLGLAHAAQQLFYGPLVAVSAKQLWQALPFAYLVVALAGGCVPAAAALLQARWGTTPGKHLFQLRIADHHGIRPRQPTLALRMIAQLLPICAATVFHVLAALGMGPLGGLICLFVGLATLGNVGFTLFDPKRRSLHDLIFRTQVVLKTVEQPPPAGNPDASCYSE